MKKIRVAVLGGSGYAGGELLRLLQLHGKVEVSLVTSEKWAGNPVTSAFPHLSCYRSHLFEPIEAEGAERRADVFLLALPHKTAKKAAARLLKAGKRVVDLSADFRLRDPSVYEAWYQTEHTERGLLRQSVYGLPEIYRSRIRKARLVANPGCYPTSAILALMPAIRKGLVIDKGIVIDSKSGVSGAGRSPQLAFLASEVSEGVRAYGLATHRHTPEIEQEVSALFGRKVTVDFTPHLIPMDRGILTTAYLRLSKAVSLEEVHEVYRRSYAKEPFVHVLPLGEYPLTKNVRGSNYCHIGLQVNRRTGTLLVVSAIDNLVKGAAGQAIHNMNLMLGFEETEGISGMGVFP